MQDKFNQHNRRRLSLDNPELFIGERIYLLSRIYGFYVIFALIGAILCTATYSIFFFFKDLYITWVRKDDRGFYYKFVVLKPHIYHVSYFAIIIAIFWGVVFFLEWRLYIILSGFLIFILGYTFFFIKHYLIDKNTFDYFDELIWFYNKLRKNRDIKIKTD